MVFKGARGGMTGNEYYFYSAGNYIPLDVLENALQISASDNDKAHLNFLIAMTMRYASEATGKHAAGCRMSLKQRSRQESKATGMTTPLLLCRMDEQQWPDYSAR